MQLRIVLTLCVVVLMCIAPGAAQETAESRGRAVLNELAAGQFEAVHARFNAQVAAALPVQKLSAVWQQLTAQVGGFKSVDAVRSQAMGANQMVEMTCTFERAPLVARVVFDAEWKIAGLTFTPPPPPASAWTPPDYVNPSAFVERDVTVGGPEFPLPGTLSVPVGRGPFPAVVLVHGSGPNDRNETIGPNQVFRDLAGGLASRGIVVLRYDKRTRVHAARLATMFGFTVKDEVTDDVRAAVTLLMNTPEVQRDRVVVAGHSLGGMLAPRIAREDNRVAGLVILAGLARTLEEAVVDQSKYLSQNDPAVVAAAEASLRQIRDPALTATTPVSLAGASIPGAYFLDLRGYDPPAVARSLNVPMLILQGERDYQVTTTDFELWKKALAERSNVAFTLYPSLNHLFIAGAGQSRPDEYMRAGHVDAAVVADIADWIHRQPR